MSSRFLLLIQMAEECVRIGKHGEIIDQLNLYSLKCSHLEFVDDLNLWGLRAFCVWRGKTHQSHTHGWFHCPSLYSTRTWILYSRS